MTEPRIIAFRVLEIDLKCLPVPVLRTIFPMIRMLYVENALINVLVVKIEQTIALPVQETETIILLSVTAKQDIMMLGRLIASHVIINAYTALIRLIRVPNAKETG